MHLAKFLSVRFNFDGDGREKARDTGGCLQDVTEQLERLVVALCRDRTHVPDDPASGIEVRGGYQETAPLGVFGSDGLEQITGYPLLDHLFERPSVQETFRRRLVLEHVGGGNVSKILGQLNVEFGPKESVGCDQRPDARAGDDGEIRPIARLCPPDEQPRTECAISATARQPEPWPAGRWQHPIELCLGIPPDARIRDAGNYGHRLIGEGERRTRKKVPWIWLHRFLGRTFLLWKFFPLGLLVLDHFPKGIVLRRFFPLWILLSLFLLRLDFLRFPLLDVLLLSLVPLGLALREIFPLEVLPLSLLPLGLVFWGFFLLDVLLLKVLLLNVFLLNVFLLWL